MSLFDQKRFGLCCKGLGVLETFSLLKFAQIGKEKMKRDDYLNADKIYVLDFETRKVYK